jgi:hypothetical protein
MNIKKPKKLNKFQTTKAEQNNKVHRKTSQSNGRHYRSFKRRMVREPLIKM